MSGYAKRPTAEEIAENERRIRKLRAMCNQAGSILEYCRRLGLSRGSIAHMLEGTARVTDRSLGKMRLQIVKKRKET